MKRITLIVLSMLAFAPPVGACSRPSKPSCHPSDVRCDYLWERYYEQLEDAADCAEREREQRNLDRLNGRDNSRLPY